MNTKLDDVYRTVVLRSQIKTKKEVDSIMGGQILELPSDKLRKAYDDGKAEGIETGRTEGIGEGINISCKNLAESLMSANPELTQAEAEKQARVLLKVDVQ